MATPPYILIVDDAGTSRMLLTRLIQQHISEAVLSEAPDGVEAIKMLLDAKTSGSPLYSRGVIIIDKEMPNCGGVEATCRLRSLGFRGLIIGVSAGASEDAAEAFLDAGADALIAKPVPHDVLLRHIAAFSAKA